eukprot:TRINITY_DN12653_c0_g1_i1.p1 TRINITY_DN12653_c0_g1~~TRINITY_DN12653_c0_g1_i1.p1  ORF type:complete len:258 (-),score=25.91 TRINITY_DN12653_c0_g1_i1:401-1174(-)
MTTTYLLASQGPTVFSGDGEELLGTLLDVQVRQRQCAREVYTGYGRELKPFDFEEQGQGRGGENVAPSPPSWEPLEKGQKNGGSCPRNIMYKQNRRKSDYDNSDSKAKKGSSKGNSPRGDKTQGSKNRNSKFFSDNSVQRKTETTRQSSFSNSNKQVEGEDGRPSRRRKHKKFSSLRQESAQAQELTLHNVAQLRGYVSDTGGSEVETFQSTSIDLSIKSESSVSLIYRSGFDGLEIEDQVPDFDYIMPSTRYAVPI